MIYRPLPILLCLVFLPAVARAVMVTEVAYDLEGSDTKREWIELHNDGAFELSLEGWSIRIGDSTSKSPLRFDAATGAVGGSLLQPGEYIIVADSVTDFLADHPAYSGKIADSTISLPNYSSTRIESIAIVLFDAASEVKVETTYFPQKEHEPGKTLELVGGHWSSSLVPGGSPGGSAVVAATPSPSVAAPLTRLVEVMSNPEGTDTEAEWVLIENYGADPADLAGWYVTDKPTASGSVHKQIIDTGVLVAAGQRYKLLLTGSFLNNSDEEISLYRKDNSLVETVLILGTAKEGISFIRTGQEWRWNEPTISPSTSAASTSGSTGTASPKSTSTKTATASPAKTATSSSTKTSPTPKTTKTPTPKSSSAKKVSPSPKLPAGLTEVAGVMQGPPTIQLSKRDQIIIAVLLVVVALGALGYRYGLHRRLFDWVRYGILKRK